MKVFSALAALVHAANAAHGDSEQQEEGASLLPSTQNLFPIIPVPPVDWSDPIPDNVMLHYQQHQERSDGNNNHATKGGLTSALKLQHNANDTFPNLLLLIRFSDHADRELPSQETIETLYMSEEGNGIDDIEDISTIRGNNPGTVPTGSVRQYYDATSHSTFFVETKVADWITVSNTEAYYADGQHGLSKSKFKEAMNEALTTLYETRGSEFFSSLDLDDNGKMDGFGVLHSGYGAEFGGKDCNGQDNTDRIWSHKGGMDWSSEDGTSSVDRYYVSSSLRGKCKSNLVRIGVLA